MPKQESIQHFDAEGMVAAVHAQEFGLRVTTNNVDSCRQLLYRAAAKLKLPIHIYTVPGRPNSLALLKKELANA